MTHLASATGIDAYILNSAVPVNAAPPHVAGSRRMPRSRTAASPGGPVPSEGETGWVADRDGEDIDLLPLALASQSCLA